METVFASVPWRTIQSILTWVICKNKGIRKIICKRSCYIFWLLVKLQENYEVGFTLCEQSSREVPRKQHSKTSMLTIKVTYSLYLLTLLTRFAYLLCLEPQMQHNVGRQRFFNTVCGSVAEQNRMTNSFKMNAFAEQEVQAGYKDHYGEDRQTGGCHSSSTLKPCLRLLTSDSCHSNAEKKTGSNGEHCCEV